MYFWLCGVNRWKSRLKRWQLHVKFVISMVTMYKYDWQEQNGKPWSGMVSKACLPTVLLPTLSQNSSVHVSTLPKWYFHVAFFKDFISLYHSLFDIRNIKNQIIEYQNTFPNNYLKIIIIWFYFSNCSVIYPIFGILKIISFLTNFNYNESRNRTAKSLYIWKCNYRYLILASNLQKLLFYVISVANLFLMCWGVTNSFSHATFLCVLHFYLKLF